MQIVHVSLIFKVAHSDKFVDFPIDPIWIFALMSGIIQNKFSGTKRAGNDADGPMDRPIGYRADISDAIETKLPY
jgi:hypothetical protein